MSHSMAMKVYSGGIYTPGFIAGLVGAKKNGLLTRGINPGQPLILVTSNSYGGFIPFDVDRAAALAELSGDFGVLNVSMNPDIQGGMSSDFLKSFRRASNRFLITQSAGNNELYDVCKYSYGWLTSQGWSYQTNDAIIVVGGLNKQGGRMTQGYHHHPSDPSPGVVRSNWGACIEVDAPAENLKSLDPKGAGSLRVSSGTSYAAPIVAAIASRYGNMATRPITRELTLQSMPNLLVTRIRPQIQEHLRELSKKFAMYQTPRAFLSLHLFKALSLLQTTT